MKPKVVSKRIFLSFLGIFLGITFILSALFSFMVLSNELSDIGKGYYNLGHAILFVILTLPGRMIEFTPMSAIIATIITFENMIRHRELIALKASGISNKFLVDLFIKISTFFVIIIFITLEFVTPFLDRQANKIRSAAITENKNLIIGDQGYWAREETWMLNIKEIKAGNLLENISIYRYNKTGGLSSYISSAEGEIIDKKRLLLKNVIQKDFTEGGIENSFYEEKVMTFDIPIFNMDIISVPIEAASLSKLFNQAMLLKERGENYRYTLSIFWQKTSIPFAVMAIVLLCIPFFVNRIPTRGELGFEIAVSIIGGTLIYFLKYILGYVAVIFEINPFYLLMFPILILFVVDLFLIRNVLK